MIISPHAYEEMLKAGISDDEIRQCLEHGELEIKQFVKGEMRYGKKIDFKDKTIMVIYTHRRNEERVITAYIIRRKKTWRK